MLLLLQTIRERRMTLPYRTGWWINVPRDYERRWKIKTVYSLAIVNSRSDKKNVEKYLVYFVWENRKKKITSTFPLDLLFPNTLYKCVYKVNVYSLFLESKSISYCTYCHQASFALWRWWREDLGNWYSNCICGCSSKKH